MALRGRQLFEKRLSSPRPIFQKLSQELFLSLPIKTIPTFFSRIPIFSTQLSVCLFAGGGFAPPIPSPFVLLNSLRNLDDKMKKTKYFSF